MSLIKKTDPSSYILQYPDGSYLFAASIVDNTLRLNQHMPIKHLWGNYCLSNNITGQVCEINIGRFLVDAISNAIENHIKENGVDIEFPKNIELYAIRGKNEDI